MFTFSDQSSRWNFILQRHIFIPLSLSLLLLIFYDFFTRYKNWPKSQASQVSGNKNKSYFSISSKLLWYSSHQPSCSKLDILDQNWTSSTISWTVSEPCTPSNASQFQHWSSSFNLPLYFTVLFPVSTLLSRWPLLACLCCECKQWLVLLHTCHV